MNENRKVEKKDHTGLAFEDRTYDCLHRRFSGMPAGFALKIWYGEQVINKNTCKILVLEKLGDTLGNIQRNMRRNRISPANIMGIAGSVISDNLSHIERIRNVLFRTTD